MLSGLDGSCAGTGAGACWTGFSVHKGALSAMPAVNEGIGAAAGAGGAKAGSLEPAGCKTTDSATMAERVSAVAGIP